MSVLIKGMYMPQYCDECWALDEYGDYPSCLITGETEGYRFNTKKYKMHRCPLVEVPTPHGRLIDASQFEVFGYDAIEGSFDEGVAFVLNKIDDAPTVIQEEE